MTMRAAIEGFLSQKNLAVVGVSRSGKKFGNTAYQELKAKGYRVFPVNPHAETVDGDVCYASLKELPETVGGVLIVVPPKETERVIHEAVDTGVRWIWMQRGAESEEAIRLCEDHGLNVVHGQCILMFAEPSGVPHRLHRWIWKLIGRLPR
jgi:hypothetical protein